MNSAQFGTAGWYSISTSPLTMGSRVLRFRGDLDAWQAAAVREAFRGVPSGQRVIVDLEDVAFIDSAGLGALIGGIRRVREGHGDVALFHPQRSLAKLLRATGVDRLAPVFPTEDEAVAWVGGRAATGDTPLPREPVGPAMLGWR